MLIGLAAKCAICGKVILDRKDGDMVFLSERALHSACLEKNLHMDIASLPIPIAKRAGYFREFTKKPANPALSANLGEHEEDEARVVGYLDKGIVIMYSTRMVRDPLDPGHPVIGTGSILTDETWDWPDYLPRLVEKYHVRLPIEFVDHMRKNGWAISGALSGSPKV
jgi:hypothetical protein